MSRLSILKNYAERKKLVAIRGKKRLFEQSFFSRNPHDFWKGAKVVPEFFGTSSEIFGNFGTSQEMFDASDQRFILWLFDS